MKNAYQSDYLTISGLAVALTPLTFSPQNLISSSLHPNYTEVVKLVKYAQTVY